MQHTYENEKGIKIVFATPNTFVVDGVHCFANFRPAICILGFHVPEPSLQCIEFKSASS